MHGYVPLSLVALHYEGVEVMLRERIDDVWALQSLDGIQDPIVSLWMADLDFLLDHLLLLLLGLLLLRLLYLYGWVLHLLLFSRALLGRLLFALELLAH